MKKVILLLLGTLSLSAGTVRLYNDSPFKLRAVVRGSDGTYLGEMVVLPENFNTWSEEYSNFGPGGSNTNRNRTMTPYSVTWYCLDGDIFGFNPNVSTGMAAIAESSNGPRYCKPPKKKSDSPYGPQENDEQLHFKNEAPPPQVPGEEEDLGTEQDREFPAPSPTE